MRDACYLGHPPGSPERITRREAGPESQVARPAPPAACKHWGCLLFPLKNLLPLAAGLSWNVFKVGSRVCQELGFVLETFLGTGPAWCDADRAPRAGLGAGQ